MIKIFVGTSANYEDAESQAVLEYSLKKHTKSELDITWIKLSRDPASPFYSNPEKGEGWNTSQWATPFSGFRWAVPWLCKFDGKGIYMDSDMIVMTDIADLWNQEFLPGKVVMGKGEKGTSRYCTSLWSCAAAQQHMLPIDQLITRADSHRIMMNYFATHQGIVQQFKGNWNCLDGEKYTNLYDPDVKVIHYTSMSHQPHLTLAKTRLEKLGRSHWIKGGTTHWRMDLVELFNQMFSEAVETGYEIDRYCQDPLFGNYVKKNTRNQSTKIPQWAK